MFIGQNCLKCKIFISGGEFQRVLDGWMVHFSVHVKAKCVS